MQGSKVDLTKLPENLTKNIGSLVKNKATNYMGLVKSIVKISGRYYYRIEISDPSSEDNGLVIESWCDNFRDNWTEV